MGVGAHVGFQTGQLGEGVGRGKTRPPGNPPGDNYAAAEAVAAQLGPQALHPFFVPGQAGVGHGLAGGFGVADHGIEVVGDPLELGVEGPHEQSSFRHGRARLPAWRRAAGLPRGSGLDGLAKGQGVGDRRHSLDPFGQQGTVLGGHALEAALGTAVFVVHTGADMRYVLAGCFDEVLHRLEHAGTDRAVRKGEHAFPRDVGRQRRLVGDHLYGGARGAWARRRRLRVTGEDQWVDALVPLGDEPEHVG